MSRAVVVLDCTWCMLQLGATQCAVRMQSLPLIAGKPSLMDRYEYVMYGKVSSSNRRFSRA
jgi:hypothetical protein